MHLERFDKNAVETIKSFISGRLSILEFMEEYEKSNQIIYFLETIINDVESGTISLKRRTLIDKFFDKENPTEFRSSVELFIKEYAQSFEDLSAEWKATPPRVGAFLKQISPLTAAGANEIHEIISDIYYQVDPVLKKTNKYENEYRFSIDVLPGYLSGGITAEAYVSQHIIPKYPKTMKKSERKKLVREEIKQAFVRDGKGFPRWIQSPEWPMDEKGEPMVYISQKSFGEHYEYYFHRVDDDEVVTVTQWW